MGPEMERSRGFSLTEVLVVLVIVGILMMAGVTMIRPRTTDSVRSVMSDVEGVLVNAQNAAYLSTQDIYLTANGDWKAGSLIIDGRPLNQANVTNPPTDPVDLVPGGTTKRVGATSECFYSLYTQGNRDHLSAGIDDTGAWYPIALGSGTQLSALPFFTATNTSFSSGMVNTFASAMTTPLCTNTQKSVVFSGVNRQWLTGFNIVVVGLAGGYPVANGPIGILVVPQGSSNIYKYFKPQGSSTWQRL